MTWCLLQLCTVCISWGILSLKEIGFRSWITTSDTCNIILCILSAFTNNAGVIVCFGESSENLPSIRLWLVTIFIHHCILVSPGSPISPLCRMTCLVHHKCGLPHSSIEVLLRILLSSSLQHELLSLPCLPLFHKCLKTNHSVLPWFNCVCSEAPLIKTLLKYGAI